MSSLDQNSRIGFIGAGTVGKTLAVVLSRHGYPVVAAASRSPASAQALAELVPGCVAYPSPDEVAGASDVVFITSPDDAIPRIAAGITWRPGQAVVHCSGAASLDVFDPAESQGALPGTFHPLQAFSSVDNGIESIPGTTFGIEGDPEMREYLGDMARAIGGNPIFLRAEDKALYHLSGVMMGNLLTALAATAAQLWEELGMERADGVKALVPMMRQVSINLESSGVPGAVAGPYVRGDIGTVRKHLEALHTRAPDVLPLYCELALAALPYALEKGVVGPDVIDQVRVLVTSFKNESSGSAGPHSG